VQGTGILLSFKAEHDAIRTWDTQRNHENMDTSLALKYEI